ncbi:NAD-dependent epimerase/dehydratase family protein [Bordetella bronchialis]|uniref:NAD-dependent epimerase/dehydratase family protein n=1 Tax=Bordetella bronchialis TaxID=463025 RepID=UPI003CFEB1B8
MADLTNARCVVLGGGGFLGTNLCAALAGKVAALRAFGRRQSFPGALGHVEWMQGDFADPTSVASAISDCDVVFHLVNATTPASANIDKVADLQANVVSTLRLLEACRAEGVKQVIFVSSGGTIYGVPRQIPTPETAPNEPITAYGISKLAIEKYLALYHRAHGIDYRVLRVANPYGPYQTALKSQGVIAAFLRKALAGQPIDVWGDGTVIRDYVYVDDVSRALIAAASYEGDEKIFNIGSGVGQSILEIAGVIESLLNTRLNMRFADARPVDVPKSVLDCRRAAVELGWQAEIQLREGMERTIAWMKSATVT